MEAELLNTSEAEDDSSPSRPELRLVKDEFGNLEARGLNDEDVELTPHIVGAVRANSLLFQHVVRKIAANRLANEFDVPQYIEAQRLVRDELLRALRVE